MTFGRLCDEEQADSSSNSSGKGFVRGMEFVMPPSSQGQDVDGRAVLVGMSELLGEEVFATCMNPSMPSVFVASCLFFQSIAARKPSVKRWPAGCVKSFDK